MREILFRGKRKDNGEWVCSGNLIQFFDNNIREVYISQYGERCNAVHDIDTDNIETITCKNGARFYKVIPETVGQFTGLTDKNGTKIFEGDICKHRSNYSGDFIISVVTYTHGCFFAMADNNSGFNLSAKLEVIGNIHDNDPPMGNFVTKAISTVDKYWKCPPIDFNVGEGGEKDE